MDIASEHHTQEADFMFLLKETKEEGKGEERTAIAKNLIELGMDNTTIAQATSLTEEAIESLRKGIEN